MVKLSGGEALAKSLAGEGVEVVFGIPGIQIYGIVAGLRDEPGIRMITTRHEQATTYMADGYAYGRRLRPRVGKAGRGPGGPWRGSLQCRCRPDQRVLPLYTRAAYCGPDPARGNRKEHRGRSRNRRPAGHGALRDQVAAAGPGTCRTPCSRRSDRCAPAALAPF